MDWNSVRNQYPERWVLIEALSTHSKDNKRDIVDMSVVSNFTETDQAWQDQAWQDLKKHHMSNPTREYYIFHTSNHDLEIIEQSFTGIRGL